MLLDTTLREGEQTFGVYMDMDTRRHIIRTLAEAGIEEMEIGYAGQEELPALFSHAREYAPEMLTTVWCRCHETDIHTAAAMGAGRISMGVPVSDAHITTRLRSTVPKLEHRLANALALARSCGIPFISIGLEDCSRANPETALRLALHGVAHGAARIRISDTVGMLTPGATARLVDFFRRNLPEHVQIATHFHNDFGMATANAITALEHGADSTDVSVLGLGERAGIARLEEVAAMGMLHEKERTGAAHGAYALDILRRLAHTVAGHINRPISPSRPIIGGDIFSAESGLHADGLRKAPALFEPFPPELVQGTRHIGLGRKTGTAAVVNAARDMGCELPAERLGELVERVRGVATRSHRPLTDDEFRTLCTEMVDPAKTPDANTAK